jgi:hypothetical protein
MPSRPRRDRELSEFPATHEGGLNLQSQNVTRAFGKGPTTTRRAMESLLAKDILREEESQGQISYRFEDPFLGVWSDHAGTQIATCPYRTSRQRRKALWLATLNIFNFSKIPFRLKGCVVDGSTNFYAR